MSQGEESPLPSTSKPTASIKEEVNTHSTGFFTIAFLLSFLWFRVNLTPILPLGLIGGVLIIVWISDIDLALGKHTDNRGFFVLCIIATILGFFINSM